MSSPTSPTPTSAITVHESVCCRRAPLNEDGRHPDVPGFVFAPSGKVLVEDYLFPKVMGLEIPFHGFKEMDIYRFNPQDLPITTSCGESLRMYCFVYMNGEKEDNGKRYTPDGFWKLTDSSKPIRNIGDPENFTAMRKKFIYFPREVGPVEEYKTIWKLDEYRIVDIKDLKDLKGLVQMKNWVVCKVKAKKFSIKRRGKKRKRQIEGCKEANTFY